MEWAKSRPAARFDLAGSNICPARSTSCPAFATRSAFNGQNENGYGPLLDAIAARYGVTADCVTTAQGASGANFLVFAALLDPGDEVLVETPGYDPLLGAPRLLGARVNQFERDFAQGFALDPDRIRHAMTPRTRVIIVTNPHNPSGVVADPAALDEIGAIARAPRRPCPGRRGLSRSGRRGRDRHDTRHAFVRAARRSIRVHEQLDEVVRPLGIAVRLDPSSPAVAERIRRTRDVVDGTGSIVAERLAVVAFNHLDRLVARSLALLNANRPILQRFLDSRRDLEWAPSAGTVVFPRVRGVDDTTALAERLLATRETAVVPGRFFQAPAHIRVGFGGPTDPLAKGLTALGAVPGRYRLTYRMSGRNASRCLPRLGREIKRSGNWKLETGNWELEKLENWNWRAGKLRYELRR